MPACVGSTSAGADGAGVTAVVSNGRAAGVDGPATAVPPPGDTESPGEPGPSGIDAVPARMTGAAVVGGMATEAAGDAVAAGVETEAGGAAFPVPGGEAAAFCADAGAAARGARPATSTAWARASRSVPAVAASAAAADFAISSASAGFLGAPVARCARTSMAGAASERLAAATVTATVGVDGAGADVQPCTESGAGAVLRLLAAARHTVSSRLPKLASGVPAASVTGGPASATGLAAGEAPLVDLPPELNVCRTMEPRSPVMASAPAACRRPTEPPRRARPVRKPRRPARPRPGSGRRDRRRRKPRS